MTTDDIEHLKEDAAGVFGDALIGSVLDSTGRQLAFCTSEEDLGESTPAPHISELRRAVRARGIRGPVMAFGVKGRLVYVVGLPA